MSKIAYVFGLLLFCISLQAQQDPQFSQFEGKLMKIPIKKMKFGPSYSEAALSYDSIGFISWPKIHIPNRTIKQGFPDVTRTQGFCMLLNSTMVINEDACYEFILASDDGSILWIDNKKIIDNDRTHAMLEKRDTFKLTVGTYPIQLWYAQVYPDQYGFVFDAHYYTADCPAMPNPFPDNISRLINIESSVLFDHDSSVLSQNGKEAIDSLIIDIDRLPIKEIVITGFTDDTGTETYNLDLSLARSTILKDYFLSQFENPSITVKAYGLGEQRPIADNATEAGRKLNRRVEIAIK